MEVFNYFTFLPDEICHSILKLTSIKLSRMINKRLMTIMQDDYYKSVTIKPANICKIKIDEDYKYIFYTGDDFCIVNNQTVIEFKRYHDSYNPTLQPVNKYNILKKIYGDDHKYLKLKILSILQYSSLGLYTKCPVYSYNYYIWSLSNAYIMNIITGRELYKSVIYKIDDINIIKSLYKQMFNKIKDYINAL